MKTPFNEAKTELKKALNDLHSKRWKRQIPNLLTASRLFSPILIIPSVLSGNLPLAAIFIGLFAATDFLDGKIAKKFNCTSKLGKILDPFTDKMFELGIVFPLMFSYPVLIINAIIEAGIGFYNLNAFNKKKNVGTQQIGRVKTVAFFTSLALGYIGLAFHNISPAVINAALLTTAGMQSASLYKYVKETKKKRKKSR